MKDSLDGERIEITRDSDLGRFGDYLALETEAARNHRLTLGPHPAQRKKTLVNDLSGPFLARPDGLKCLDPRYWR